MAIYAYGSRGFGDLNYNPFSAPQWQNLSPAQEEYYRSEPNAVFGAFDRGLSPAGYGNRFTDFANQWVRKMYGQYQGDVGFDPELSFVSYLQQRQPRLRSDYIQSLGTRPIVRPTRIVR